MKARDESSDEFLFYFNNSFSDLIIIGKMERKYSTGNAKFPLKSHF